MDVGEIDLPETSEIEKMNDNRYGNERSGEEKTRKNKTYVH